MITSQDDADDRAVAKSGAYDAGAGRLLEHAPRRAGPGARRPGPPPSGCSVSSCWANSAMPKGARLVAPPASSVGSAHPVVLDDEAVQALERVVLVDGDLAEALGRRTDRLLEQGQQQLVFSAEVLVEAVQ